MAYTTHGTTNGSQGRRFFENQGGKPTELSDDMRTGDLIEALATLHFRGQGRCVVVLDRGVRDYLLSALAARRGKPGG